MDSKRETKLLLKKENNMEIGKVNTYSQRQYNEEMFLADTLGQLRSMYPFAVDSTPLFLPAN